MSECEKPAESQRAGLVAFEVGPAWRRAAGCLRLLTAGTAVSNLRAPKATVVAFGGKPAMAVSGEKHAPGRLVGGRRLAEWQGGLALGLPNVEASIRE